MKKYIFLLSFYAMSSLQASYDEEIINFITAFNGWIKIMDHDVFNEQNFCDQKKRVKEFLEKIISSVAPFHDTDLNKELTALRDDITKIKNGSEDMLLNDAGLKIQTFQQQIAVLLDKKQK